MKELTFSDYINLALIGIAIFYLFLKVANGISAMLYDFGWCKYKYTMFKNKKDLAVMNICRAFDLNKGTIDKVRAIPLTDGFVMLLISKEKADEIWKEHDAKESEK